MLRYARAAIGLVAAIFVAAFVHGLMAPRIAEGAYGAAGESGWLAFVVDLLAFGGTWVTVAGLLANRAVGAVLEKLLERSGHRLSQPPPVPRTQGSCHGHSVASIVAQHAQPAAEQRPAEPKQRSLTEGWTTSEQLAGRSAMKALKAGDAGEYLLAFRLLHPGSDAALARSLSPDTLASEGKAPADAPAPKRRTTRGK